MKRLIPFAFLLLAVIAMNCSERSTQIEGALLADKDLAISVESVDIPDGLDIADQGSMQVVSGFKIDRSPGFHTVGHEPAQEGIPNRIFEQLLLKVQNRDPFSQGVKQYLLEEGCGVGQGGE